ncbi:MAG: UvrD-helicase domain-containing protein [[Clostridium] leptum]
MSKRNWTESQRWAISARNGSLLVSAAAGSGKTAVLVQRVIERLTDPERPCDADRLLIVTFTNAAAAEMKERISAAIGELLQADPANAQLQRQQILLNRAHISTIHSFCNELVRENFYKLDISPDFRISDSAEMTLLRQEAMDEVMEELYAKEDGSFQGLSDAFSFGRDDRRLMETVETLYDLSGLILFRNGGWTKRKPCTGRIFRQARPSGEKSYWIMPKAPWTTWRR